MTAAFTCPEDMVLPASARPWIVFKINKAKKKKKDKFSPCAPLFLLHLGTKKAAGNLCPRGVPALVAGSPGLVLPQAGSLAGSPSSSLPTRLSPVPVQDLEHLRSIADLAWLTCTVRHPLRLTRNLPIAGVFQSTCMS